MGHPVSKDIKDQQDHTASQECNGLSIIQNHTKNIIGP